MQQLTQTKNSKTLTSLALIEAQLLSRDYLSTFLPFISTLVLKNKYESIEIGVIIDDFKNEFGINIPRAPMQAILSKAVSNGLFTTLKEGRYMPILSELQKISFLNQQNSNITNINSFINNFVSFVHLNHSISISIDEAIDIFICFLDEYSPRTISGEYNNVESEQYASNRNLFLMGEYIQSISKTDFSHFETIRKLSMAYLITTALTFDEPVENRSNDLSEMTIYLDTPIVLRLLGLQTEELEAAYRAMFENFQSVLNSKFLVFQHTLEEISGIITDCAHWIDSPAYNPAYANPALLNFIKRKYSKTQIELYKNKLEDLLNELNISIDDKEYYNLPQHHKTQINEIIFKGKLIETYSANNPQFDVARSDTSINYDFRSIDYIVKLWGTKSSRTYKNLKYLFLTSNSTLAYVSRKFTSDYWWDKKNHKAPCITDYYLGTMVWLSTPSEKIENVSKLKLLADCSAATTLSREIMEKFSVELDRLYHTKGIKNEDYLLLRKYGYEENYLQNITLNDETAYKDDIFEQLLEEIKIRLQKPLIENIQEKDTQIDELKLENNEQTRIINELKKEKRDEIERNTLEVANISERVKKSANRITNTYAPIMMALFSAVFIFLQILFSQSTIVNTIKIIAAIVSLCSAVFIGVMKSNLFGMFDKLTKRVENYYRIINYKKKIK